MKRHLIRTLLIFAALLVALIIIPPQQSDALAPLAYRWHCNAYNGSCSFTVTTSNHSFYNWNYGDGSFSGISSSTTVYHTYNVPKSQNPYYFTVYLIGYNSSASSPDNIIGCTIEVYNSYSPGGNPGTAGTCN
jgi:hypothetical protein